MNKSSIPYILLLTAVVALAPQSLSGQTAEKLAGTPLEQLQQLSVSSTLDVEGMPPWHLRMSFDLFDLTGKPQESGTIEEWWVSPSSRRIVVNTPSGNATFPGSLYANYDRRTYLLDTVLAQVVHPVPDFRNFQGMQVQPDTHKFGNVELQCLTIFLTAAGKAKRPFSSSLPKFCTEPDAYLLRLSLDAGDFAASRNNLVRFVNKSVPRDVAISYAGRVAISAHLDSLETYRPSDTPLETTSDPLIPFVPRLLMTPQQPKSSTPACMSDVSPSLVSGHIVFAFTVSKQGAIQSFDVVASPDPSLTAFGKKAVCAIAFKPFLIDGQPDFVRTVFTLDNRFEGVTVYQFPPARP